MAIIHFILYHGGGTKSKRLYYREAFSNLPVLAEGDWRFSVVEGDTIPFSPEIPSKSNPLIGATRELLLFTFASCGANQSEACFLGENWVKVELLSTSTH